MSENDYHEGVEMGFPDLDNGTISLFEWISRGEIIEKEGHLASLSTANVEKVKVAYVLFEGHQMLVKEIEQKYMKFLSGEDKCHIMKVIQNIKKYEKEQSEFQAVISEIITSSEMMHALNNKLSMGSNRDTNSRLRLKLVERRYFKLRSALADAKCYSEKLINELIADFPRIAEIANNLEKRFHHNLGRFTQPGHNEKDSSKVGKSPQGMTSSKNSSTSSKKASKVGKKKLEIQSEITGKVSERTADDLLQRVDDNERKSNNKVKKQLNVDSKDSKNGQKGKKKKKMPKRSTLKSSGANHEKHEKCKVEISTKCSSFFDGPNDKGVQTDVYDDYDYNAKFSDGEDILLVEISEDESDHSTGTN